MMVKLLAGMLLASAGSGRAAVHYVDVNSTNATPPYTNWATAAATIQDAVDAAVAGDEVVVTNGAYYGSYSLADRLVMIDKSVSVRSVNGPQFTWILGNEFQYPLVWMTTEASLSGFTLSGGYSLGGGSGGEAWGGTLNDCRLIDNRADGFGGGAFECTLNNCTLTDNFLYGGGDGGGAAYCTLNNCTLVNNTGWAAYQCNLINCTLMHNVGGAAYQCGLVNCILFTNLHLAPDDFGHYTIWVCDDCDSPGRLVGNNWVGNPLFVDQASGNLRLQPNSPCINAGNNSYVTNATDLDGNPRISGGTVDIGAYEYQWPQLTIAHSGPNVLLAWPTNNAGYDYAGFTLQSTTNLVPPVVWSTNFPVPVVIAGKNTVTNPISGPQKFYRLVQ